MLRERPNDRTRPGLPRNPLSPGILPSRLLPIVVFWLSVAIVLKSVGLVDAAFAQHPPQTGATATTGSAGTSTPPPAVKSSIPYSPVANWTDRPPPPPMCKPDALDETGESAILLELKRREAALNARSKALSREQQELDVTKAALEQQVMALKPLADRLESLKAAKQSKDDAKWASLVETYGAMEPRSAARIFDGLDPSIVFNVLHRMNSRKSAAILASMSPPKAQAITERLAGKSAVPPTLQPVNALLPDGAP